MLKRKVILFIAAVVVGLASPGWMAAPLRADWSILKYDKDGNVIIRRGAGPDGEGGTAASDRAPAAPAQPMAPSRQAAPSPQAVPDAPDGRFVDNEVLVVDPPRNFVSVASQMGFAVIDSVTLGNLSIAVFRLRVPPGTTVAAALGQLRGRFPGLLADANHLFDPSGRTTSPVQQARLVLNWQDAPEGCGRNVRLGMIDGALDLQHPALAGQRIKYRSFHDAALKPGRQDHGTAIAAMLVGKTPWGGLLPAAQLRAANIFEVSASGKVSANIFGLMRAVDWLVGERVHIINLSIAGAKNKVLGRVLKTVMERGAAMVAAAGNGGRAARPAYPAAYPYVLAVTAVTAERAVYANANRGNYVDFAAPGVEIWTAVPGGGKVQSGTSFSAPYVAVLAGLEVARNAGANPSSLRTLLRRHTVDLGVPGKDDTFGWGLIDMQRNCNG